MSNNTLFHKCLLHILATFEYYNPKEDLKKGRLKMCDCKSIHNLAQSAVLLLLSL